MLNERIYGVISKGGDNLVAAIRNNDGVLEYRVGEDTWVPIQGRFGITDTTYTELKAKVDAGELIPGHFYKITDYTPKYVLADQTEFTGEATTETSENTEELLVQAATEDKLYCEAFSCNYPEDIIHYDINNDTTRYDWAVAEGCGVIYRRIDTKRRIDCYYDWRNIRFYRYKVDTSGLATWTAGTFNTFTVGDLVLYNGAIYQYFKQIPDSVTRMTSPSTNYFKVVISSATVNDKCFLCSGGQRIYWGYNKFKVLIPDENESTLCYTFESTTRDVDIRWSNSGTMVKLSNSVFYATTTGVKISELLDTTFLGSVYGIDFGRTSYCLFQGILNRCRAKSNFRYNTIGSNFQYNTIGNYFEYNTIGSNFQDNTIGNYFEYNTIGSDFEYNTIGSDFQYNTIGSYFRYNTIGSYFRNNTIGSNVQYNTIGSNFQYNTIGNYFEYNTIGSYFRNNTIGSNFQDNTIGNYFEYNTIGSDFEYNTIGSDFQYNTIGSNFQDNFLPNLFLNSAEIGDNFCGNHSVGTDYFQETSTIVVGDNFMNNIIHNNIQADLTSYVQLYKLTTGDGTEESPIVTEYGGYTIEPTAFDQYGVATAWCARKINPDGTITTFAIV